MRNINASHQVTEPFYPGPLSAIIFDCDGVLFDSREANVRFYSHILEKVGGPPVRPEQHEYIHMYPVRESLRFLLGDTDQLKEAWAYCSGLDFRMFNSHLRCEPAIHETLALAQQNYFTAVATNRTVSTHEVLELHALDKYFDLVVSASDVPRPKPYPDCMERILSTFKILPGQALYIGDSPVDAELAATTGVFFIAYKNPRLPAHLHINHFEEIHPLLRSCKTGRP